MVWKIYGLLFILLFVEATGQTFVMYNDGKYSYSQQDIYKATVSCSMYGGPGALYCVGFMNSTANPDGGSFTLGTFMNVDTGINTTSRVIWEANRDDPVGWNATLTLQSDGDLVLKDADGRFVWSSNTSNKGVVEHAWQDNGNMVLRDSNGTIIWQTFDHPSDTLMRDQVFRPGMKLVSRKSLTDPSPGYYSLVMEAGGLALYANLTGSLEPYWVRSYFGPSDLFSVTHTCDSIIASVLSFNAFSSLELLLDLHLANISAPSEQISTPLCDYNATSRISSWNGNYNRSFIRLEYDGNIRIYTLGDVGEWATLAPLIAEAGCQLPTKCGDSYGICSNAGMCNNCLKDKASNDTCLPIPGQGFCNGSYDPSSFEFKALDGGGLEYFSNKYISNQGTPTTEDQCRDQCLQNCSCSAFFYWPESQFCFQAENLHTLQSVDDNTHLAYVKMPTQSPAPQTESGNTGGPNTVIAVVLSIASAIAVICGIIVVCFLKKRRKRSSAGFDSDEDEDYNAILDSLMESKPIRFSHEDLARITDGFSKKLGTGGFGGVYEGRLLDGRMAAVKKLESRGQGKKEFHAEIAVLGAIHHWNLVKLIGFCADGVHRLLVYECMPNGSLDKWIFNPSSDLPLLNWRMRMDILLGTARGLAYLHEECKERIIHLDIKPQNILLDESFVAKVADFGLSRLMARDQSYVVTTMRGTPGYLAPEWLRDAAITEKSDVYSFGVVVLEVICGRNNLMQSSSSSSSTTKTYLPSWAMECAEKGEELQLLDSALLPYAIDELEEARRTFKIAFLCIQEDPGLRPCMGKVVQMMEGHMQIPDSTSLMKQNLLLAMQAQAQLVSGISEINPAPSQTTATSANTQITNNISLSSYKLSSTSSIELRSVYSPR